MANKSSAKLKAQKASSSALCSASPVEVLTAHNWESFPPTKSGGISEAFSMAAARAMGLKRDGIKVEVKWCP